MYTFIYICPSIHNSITEKCSPLTYYILVDHDEYGDYVHCDAHAVPISSPTTPSTPHSPQCHRIAQRTPIDSSSTWLQH